MSTGADLSVINSLYALILPLTRSDGSTIVPQTTLSVAARAGYQSITVASAAHLVRDGLISFEDGSGEAALPIAGVTGTTVALDFTGLGYSGLRYAHNVGAVVSTNLLREMQEIPAAMLSLGDPAIFLSVVSETEALRTVHQSGAVLTAHIQMHRSLLSVNGMNSTVWSQRQQEATRSDLELIATAIKNNRSLTVNGVDGALGLGQYKRPETPFLTKNWGKFAQMSDIPQFVATLQVVIQARWEQF